MADQGSSIKLKLLIDTKGKRVLYAEAGKDFVDFLFHILSLPVATVVDLLAVRGKSMVGSLGDLCKSIENLNSEYLQPDMTKDSVLKPKLTSITTPVKVPLLLPEDTLNISAPVTKKFYHCPNSRISYNNCYMYVSDGDGVACSSCGRMMTREMSFVAPKGVTELTTSSSNTGVVIGESQSGYVKGLVTYMVMDNLEVKPLSSISGITLFNKFHVKDITSLVEKDVHIDLTEGVALLKASLQTKVVLTSVFL